MEKFENRMHRVECLFETFMNVCGMFNVANAHTDEGMVCGCEREKHERNGEGNTWVSEMYICFYSCKMCAGSSSSDRISADFIFA